MAMTSTSTSDTPDGLYLKAVKYIVRKLKEETKGDGDEAVGVRWGIVKGWYLDQFADQNRLNDDDYLAEQKDLASKALRRMSQERVLKGAKRDDGHANWIVHPSCKVVDNVDSTPENQNSNASDGNRNPRIDPAEDGETIEVEAPSIEEREANQHAEAYAEMTKLAVPLRQDATGPSKPQPNTPSKKRRRVEEIAASGASSRYTSLSPRRRSNTASEAGRSSRRLATPEENRRVSAPSRVEKDSPVQANTPKRRKYKERPSTPLFKEEKKHSSPAWLLAALGDLLSKYPNERISAHKDTAKCLDCDSRVFNIISKTGRPLMHILEQHFKGKAHKDRVAERISREEKESMMTEPSFSSMFKCAIPTFTEFLPPQPIQCFSLPALPASPSISTREPNFRQARAAINKYMEDIENDSAARRVAATLLAQRQGELERIHEEGLEKLRMSLIESDEKNKRLCVELGDSLTSQTQESKDQAQRMEDMILDTRQKNMDHASSLGQLEGRLAISDSRTQQQIDSMGEQLIKSDGKYFEVMGRLASSEQSWKQEAEELANRVDTLEERNQELIDGLLAQTTAQVSESEMRQREHTKGFLRQVTSQLSDSETRQKTQFGEMRQSIASSAGTATEQIDRLTQELATAKQYTKEILTPIMTRLIPLEKATEKQNDYIHDLESQSQLHTEELQRQRNSEETLRQNLFAQIDVRFNQTAERIRTLEQQTTERIQAVEESSAARIKKVEKVNKDLVERIERFEQVFPVFMGQIDDLGKCVEELGESIAEHEQRPRSPRPQARRRKTGPRPV